ncbi:MAG: phage major capsid protein [Janthinobacterium lividum]
MDRAYSILEVKAVRDGPEEVVIEGIASTPATDRMGDIVEPLGAKFVLPMPLLLMHDHDKPVGKVIFAQATANGIPFKAVLPVIKDAGVLKDRVDEAIHSVRNGLIRAVSIGFRATKDGMERMASGGVRWKSWEWIELSLVSIPANAQATISAVRAIDTEARRSVSVTPATRPPITVPPATSKGHHMASLSLVPKGVVFGRFARALAAGGDSLFAAQAFAEGQNWTDTPQVVSSLKAAVAAMSTTDVPTAMKPITIDFAEVLRPQTIIGRIQGFRRVPFNVRMVRGNTGVVAGWVGQSLSIPVASGSYDAADVLQPRKVGTIAIVTQELMRSSAPSADIVISSDITAAVAQALDSAFISVTNAGVSELKPASVTYGGFIIPSTGSTVDTLDADLQTLINNFNVEKIPLAAPVWVMSPTAALTMSMMRSPSVGGPFAYPGLSIRGGTLLGIPVVTSQAAAGQITLMDAAEIDLADDGDAEIDLSEHAALQMDTSPDNPPTAATVVTPLWQRNLVGIRGLRFVNWAPRRAKAVGTITGGIF